MATVFANGRSILHKGDGGTHIAAPPDVCKTPSPGGPIPIPYVNIAKTSDLAKGSKKVKIEGNPVALESSNLSTSMGDEPGTAGGGIISSKTKGKLTWGMSSPDVKIEGKGVVRFLDLGQHNGNTFNTAFIAMGTTGLAYGDDAVCPVCDKSIDKHRVLEMDEVAGNAEAIILHMLEALEPQRAVIAKHQALKREWKSMWDDFERKLDAVGNKREPLERAKANILAQKTKDTAKLAEIGKALAPLVREEKALKDARKAEDKRLTEQMDALNDSLEGKNVLVLDKNTRTYTKGFMVGALVCKCETDPKKIASCSGEATPGFEKAVEAKKFRRVDAFTLTDNQAEEIKRRGRKKWDAPPRSCSRRGARTATR